MFEENTKLYGILFLVFLRYTQKGAGKNSCGKKCSAWIYWPGEVLQQKFRCWQQQECGERGCFTTMCAILGNNWRPSWKHVLWFFVLRPQLLSLKLPEKSPLKIKDWNLFSSLKKGRFFWPIFRAEIFSCSFQAPESWFFSRKLHETSGNDSLRDGGKPLPGACWGGQKPEPVTLCVNMTYRWWKTYENLWNPT